MATKTFQYHSDPFSFALPSDYNSKADNPWRMKFYLLRLCGEKMRTKASVHSVQLLDDDNVASINFSV
jgi:hypothetical protein